MLSWLVFIVQQEKFIFGCKWGLRNVMRKKGGYTENFKFEYISICRQSSKKELRGKIQNH